MAKRKAIDDERLEEIKSAMCDHYCRFPLEYSMEYEFPRTDTRRCWKNGAQSAR